MSEIRMGLLQITLGVTNFSFGENFFLFGVLGAWGKQKAGQEFVPALDLFKM